MTPELLALETRVLVRRMYAEHWQNTSTTVTSIVTNHSLLAVVYSAIVHVHLHVHTVSLRYTYHYSNSLYERSILLLWMYLVCDDCM